MFFSLPDPDLLVRVMDPGPDPEPDPDPWWILYHHAKLIRKTLNPTIF